MAQVTQHRTVTLPRGVTPATLSFDQFDPALGTLQSVTFGLAATVTGSVSVENYDPVAVEAKAGLQAEVWLYGPSMYSFTHAEASANGSAALAGYDGVADFAGVSGTVMGNLTGSNSATGVIDASVVQAGGLVGTGQAIFTLTSLDNVTLSAGGGLRLLSDIEAIVGDVTVVYNFVPDGGGSGVQTVINTVPVIPVDVVQPFVQTTTSARKTYSTASAPVGTAQTVAVDRFDPTLGTLVAINLRLRTTETGHAAVEGMQPTYAALNVAQTIRSQASITGVASPLASATASGSSHLSFQGGDGTADFAGPGAATNDWSGTGTGVARVTEAAVLAAFSGGGTVDLSLLTGGTTNLLGTSDLLADITASASEVVEVSYSYTPVDPVTPIAVANGSTGAQAQPVPQAYAGPVAGIVNEFVQITPDNLSISAGTDNWYIRTGDGMDAISVRDGHNVLDGGGGSNFLVGGVGQNDFFLDAIAPTAPVWSTIIGMRAGDTLTIWGYEAGDTIYWHDDEGADGVKGLTLHMPVTGGFEAVATLAGYTFADFLDGKLQTGAATAGGIPYMLIAA